ncbi:MAG: segregation and condensation protein [Fibrobacterota bacterium]
MTLDVFSGPLDLLLYLVHNQELDPRTIPVSEIADQYLKFLDLAQENNLGVAGEYLVMAAKLLALKARELLPREMQGELEPEEFDGFDREELVRQLLEYRRFKQAAGNLRNMEARIWCTYPRGMTDGQGERPKVEDDEGLEAGLVGLFDLLKAFRQVLSVRPRSHVHEIEIDDIPLEERMNRIRAHLVRDGRAQFDELYPHDGRRLLPVVTFMAIMELVKTEELCFRQAGTWQPMVVYRKADTRYEDELAEMDQVYTPDPIVNPDVLGLLAQKERLRIEALAREEALWGGDGTDPETGEPLPQLELDGPTDVPTAEPDPASVSDSPASPGNLDPAILETEIVALLEDGAMVSDPAAADAQDGLIEPAPKSADPIDYEALFDAALAEEILPEDAPAGNQTDFVATETDIAAIENETPAADLDVEVEASIGAVDAAPEPDDSRFQIGIDSQANPDSSLMDESDFDDDEEKT